MATFILCFVFPLIGLLFLSSPIAGSYPKLRPNGTVDFGPKQTESYDTGLVTEFDAQGLGAWYDFVISFINTVQSEQIPVDLIEKYTSGGESVDLSNTAGLWKEWQDFELPVVICIGIGVLFMMIMPIVGFCFCCCRLCGNCGGEMVQKKSSNTSCKRKSFSVCLLIIFIFMFVGVIMTFVCNDRMTKSVSNTQTFASDAITETAGFVDKVIDEIKGVTDTDFQKVLALLDDQLSDSGIKTGLGDKLLDKLKQTVDEPIKAVQNLSEEVINLQTALGVMVNTTGGLKNLSQTLSDELNDVKADIEHCKSLCAGSSVLDSNACVGLSTDGLKMDANFTALDDVSAEQTKIDDVVQQDFKAKAQEGYDKFLEIPERIVNESRSARNNVNDTINDMKGQVNNFTDSFTEQLSNISTNAEKYKTEVNNIFDDYVKPYDQYRWYAGVGLTCILLLIVVLVGLGMMCGICGYDKEAMPSSRSAVSTMGGNSLMAAAGFCFVFCSFLMLLTTICFLIGFHFQKFCEPVTDDTVLDWLKEEKFGKIQVFGNSSMDLKKAIVDCRNNKPVYEAMNLKDSPDLNLRTKFNITELMGNNFDDKINDLNVNVNDTKILPQEAKDSLTDLTKGSVENITFDAFINQTNKAIVAIDLDALATNLTLIASKLSNATVAKCFNDSAAKLRNISATTVADMKRKSKELGDNVQSIKDVGSNLKVKAQSVLDAAEKANNYINTNVSEDVKEVTKEYGNNLVNTVTSYVDYVYASIEGDSGRCQAIGDIYDGLVNVFCREFPYPFNGFWVAIGWCLFFFIPCIIFCVKLAKHYRCMKYEDGFDDEMGVENYPMSTRQPQSVGPEKKMWNQGSNAVHPK